jgi:hypothetical protein
MFRCISCVVAPAAYVEDVQRCFFDQLTPSELATLAVALPRERAA